MARLDLFTLQAAFDEKQTAPFTFSSQQLTSAKTGHDPTPMSLEPHILLSLGALVLFGISDLVYKRAAMLGVPTHRLFMVQSSCYGVLVTLYGIASGTLVFNLAALWGVLAGMFAFTGFYNFAQSLRDGHVSINAPVFRLSFVLTAILAVVFLGESLTPAKLIGLLIALVAVWLLMGDRLAGVTAKVRLHSLLRVLSATVTVSIANLLYKVALREGATAAGILVVQAMTVITMSTTLVYVRERQLKPDRVTVHHGLATSVLLALGFVMLMEALARGEASVVVPIAQLGFVVTALLGVIVMREAVTGRKLLGIGLAIAALASLARS